MFYLNNLSIGDGVSFYNILSTLKNIVDKNEGDFRKYMYRIINKERDAEEDATILKIAKAFDNISHEIFDFLWHDGIYGLIRHYGNGNIKNISIDTITTHLENSSMSYRPIELDFFKEKINEMKNLILREKRRKLKKIVLTAVTEISSVINELYELFEKKSFLSCVLLTDDEFERFMKLGNEHLFREIYSITNELLPNASKFFDLDENKNDFLVVESALYRFHDVLTRQLFKHDLLNLMLLKKELDYLFFTAMSVFPYYIVEEKEYYKRVFGIYRESVLKIEQIKVNLSNYLNETRKLSRVS